MAVKKYVKFDTELGYLDNKDDINYFSTIQMRKIAFGRMLGEFDENGLYVINQKIVEELIKMPKVIVEIVEESDLIRSKVKADAFFHFILTVEDNKVSLKLLEKINYQSNKDFNSGTYSNINEYVLDEVIVTDKDFNRNALYEKYNISVENDGEVLSIFDMDELSIALYYNIVEKLKVNYLVENELILKEKELENIEADYFEAMLGVIGEFKGFGDKVSAGLKKDLAEKYNFVIISKPFFQRTVNEMLDSYVDLYIQDLSPEQKEQALSKIREIKAKYYQKFKTLLPIEIVKESGVRFDKSQILQEGVIGDLVREISTKGFISSDVRKILINEDELQLSISKIKEIVKENEEFCKRDNTKARDIINGRKLTEGFYTQLEKEDKVDILKPDTTLIKSKIEEKQPVKEQVVAQKAEQVKAPNRQIENNKVANNARTPSKNTQQAQARTSENTTKPVKGAETPVKQQTPSNQPSVSSSASTYYGGYDSNTTTRTPSDGERRQIRREGAMGALIDELQSGNRTTARQASERRKTDEFIRAQGTDLMK